MAVRTLFLVLVGAVAMAGCGENIGHTEAAWNSSVPAAVNCADAAQFNQRALDERRQRDETSSDQERIVSGNRATFYASLATIAGLKCKVTAPEADVALNRALDAARKAEGTRSFYERAVWWTDASFSATQVVSMLMKRLPAPPPQ